MKKNVLLLPLLMTTLFYAGCVPKTSPKVIHQIINTTPPPPSINSPQIRNLPLSTFSYNKFQTVQGPILTIGKNHRGFLFPDFKGKIILLEIFGQDCHYCFKELPSIAHLHSKYSQNLQVVALQVQEQMSRGTANSLIRKFNMNYPIIDREDGSDLMYTLKNNYDWNGILPFTLLIKNGVTQQLFSGETSQQELEEAIRELL